MTDHRVVMQMALDTLEGFSPLDVCRDVHHHRNDYHGVLENCPVYERHKQTITDLRAAIAQPEQKAPLITTPKYGRCTDTLRNLGKPYPRTCAECGLGPCKAKSAQKEQTADLQHVIETLTDHGNGKYRGAVSKAQREKAIAICGALEHPANERNFCPRCGKRLGGADDVHTCTPHAHTKENK